MVMPADFVVVRHGESESNVARRRARRGDHRWLEHPEYRARHPSLAHLTDDGIHQPRDSGAWIKAEVGDTFDLYYVSSYIRAIESAAYLDLPDARWSLEHRLREHDFGREAHLNRREVDLPEFVQSALMRQSDPFFARRVGGESPHDVIVKNVRDMLDTLHREAAGKRVVMVCHGEYMRCLHAEIARLTPRQYADWLSSADPTDQIHNGQVFHYTRRRDPEDRHCRDLTRRITAWRSISPSDLSLCDPSWRPITRPFYTNAELLELAAQAPPRLIHTSRTRPPAATT